MSVSRYLYPVGFHRISHWIYSQVDFSINECSENKHNMIATHQQCPWNSDNHFMEKLVATDNIDCNKRNE